MLTGGIPEQVEPLEAHPSAEELAGAVVHQGMTVLARTSAVVIRIRPQQRSKRAQKFRRLLGLKSPKINEINHQKNE